LKVVKLSHCVLFLFLLHFPLFSSETFHLTYNGDTCVDECRYYSSKEYYWCRTLSGWGYCSPQQDKTYKRENCRSDHKCGFYGSTYSWCYTTNNKDYDYCGLVVPRMCPRTSLQLTCNFENCINDCTYSKKMHSFWCYTKNSWDYCSPIQDFTYKGTPCRSGHECGSHGYSYSWCYTTDNNDYDYCGQILTLPPCHDVSRFKRSLDQRGICRIEGTDYTVEQTNKLANCTRRLRKDAEELINRWIGKPLRDKPKSNLLTSDNLRIDIQGALGHNVNLQIQVNSQRRRGGSTSLAQIIIPNDASDDEIRTAFTLMRCHYLIKSTCNPM
uniref:Uncharacterized protein n=1 Tax=Gadus morhua TaxID=8049 RepID=A0A8C5FS42_GADMO